MNSSSLLQISTPKGAGQRNSLIRWWRAAQVAVALALCAFLSASCNLQMGKKGPRLASPPLHEFTPGDWQSVREAFAKSPEISLGQSWSKLQDRFHPAVVRTGGRDDILWIYAEIEDLDIVNPETRFNESSS